MSSENLFFEGFAPPTRRRRERLPGRLPRVAAEAASEPAVDFVQTLLSRAHLPVAAYRMPALCRRLPACLRFLGEPTVDRARNRIESDPLLAQATLNVALLGVTGFFRDRAVFAQLATDVLPNLCTERARLRVWSAACSGGHELYSVAMMLADLRRLDGCELLGTDCREEAIAGAREGRFPFAEVAPLPPALRARHLAFDGSQARITAGLRWATTWKVADLCTAVESGPWDLLLWRNMAIYLESTAAASIWRALCEQLAPGGYVVCGKADHLPPGLPLRRVGSCIYQHAP
jgi:chemotaxis methyl-accepting protein methylase